MVAAAMFWLTAERVCARDLQACVAELDSRGWERVCVEFEDQIDLSVLRDCGAEIVRTLQSINAIICRIDARQIERLRRLPGIKAVEPDVVMYLPPAPVPAQPRGDLAATGFTGPAEVRWNHAEAGLNAKAAWDRYGLDGSGVSIAVIDTGINYKLADLADNYLGGDDLLDDDGDPLTQDSSEYHGTEVAALAVGAGAGRIVGVAHKAGFYALRAGDSSNAFFVSNLIAALEWTAQGRKRKEDIVSMSFGVPEGMQTDSWRTYWDAKLRKAVDDAAGRGVILVASSGNDGAAGSWPPASYENVISVGAHGESQRVASFSNGGVDVVAPGERVVSIDPSDAQRTVSGTSYAAPHIAGLVALQLQYARQHGILANAGYHREVMKHGAVILGHQTGWEGSGKAWAAAAQPEDSRKGSIDLMALHWPIRYAVDFLDYAYREGDIPVYYMGTQMRQQVALTNVTDALGNAREQIEDLEVKVRQAAMPDSNDGNVDPQMIQWMSIVPLLDSGGAASVAVSNSYAVPQSPAAGLNGTIIGFGFHFAGKGTAIEVTYTQAEALWQAATPGDLNLDYRVDAADFARFAGHWRHGESDPGDAWRRADLNQDRTIDWRDLATMSDHWLWTPSVPSAE